MKSGVLYTPYGEKIRADVAELYRKHAAEQEVSHERSAVAVLMIVQLVELMGDEIAKETASEKPAALHAAVVTVLETIGEMYPTVVKIAPDYIAPQSSKKVH